MVGKEEPRKARADENNELVELINCRSQDADFAQRFILLKNPAFGGTEKQANYLQGLCEINQPIYQAMLLKESFLQIYSYSEIEEVKAYLRDWIKEALSSSYECIRISLKLYFSQKLF